MIFANGSYETITGYTSATSLTGSSTTISESGSAYRLHYMGLQVTNSGNVGIGTSSPNATLEVVGSINATSNITVAGHIISSGATPTITAGSGAGTSPTVSISGNDITGTISITTGTSPAASTLATITFSTAYGTAPNVLLTPVGSVSASIQYNLGSSSTTNFTLNTGTAPAASTTYTYKYFVIQ
jgi:hypothetical protein